MRSILVARLTEETVLLHYYNTINTPTPNYKNWQSGFQSVSSSPYKAVIESLLAPALPVSNADPLD